VRRTWVRNYWNAELTRDLSLSLFDSRPAPGRHLYSFLSFFFTNPFFFIVYLSCHVIAPMECMAVRGCSHNLSCQLVVGRARWTGRGTSRSGEAFPLDYRRIRFMYDCVYRCMSVCLFWYQRLQDQHADRHAAASSKYSRLSLLTPAPPWPVRPPTCPAAVRPG
jgi:hypothetical protein